MTTAIEKTSDQKRSALVVMANKFQVEPKQLLSTLKDTAFRGATDSQMMALCVVANEYGLNPFTKEIYAFPDKKGGGISRLYRAMDGIESQMITISLTGAN